MDRSAMDDITERLSSIEGLYFPGAIHREAPDPSHRKSALLDLLSRDAPIFLERYGTELTFEELGAFETLTTDYEVGWHLNRLRRQRQPPTEEEARARAATVKNRRRAYMEKLVLGGEYFSEDSMREREPYLHHEYLGKFQDPMGRAMLRPGESWSETLMRRWEEAVLVEKIRGEQQRLGVDRRDWIGGVREEEMQEEEEEEEEEEEKGEEEKGKEEEEEREESEEETDVQMEGGEMSSARKILVDKDSKEQDSNDGTQGIVTEAFKQKQILSAEEMQDQLEQFTHIMQQKFLAGEDTGHLDYSQIDNDERLDDHWLREASHDAEEKYFEED
ncbi:uncharacterized protein [Typha angustifolia]|uniref:uncharacterized protein isoform X1 n=1 Tax=Typha angustifolia TaxID=59011 RepID=UPI003C2D3FCD